MARTRNPVTSTGPEGPAPAAGSETPEQGAGASVRAVHPKKEKEYAGTGIIAGLVVALILAVATVIFIAQNGERVAVEWLWGDARVSLAVVVLAALLVGVIGDEAVGIAIRHARRRRLAEKQELESLRARARTTRRRHRAVSGGRWA
jgi:uncharacterized integral membrane protein